MWSYESSTRITKYKRRGQTGQSKIGKKTNPWSTLTEDPVVIFCCCNQSASSFGMLLFWDTFLLSFLLKSGLPNFHKHSVNLNHFAHWPLTNLSPAHRTSAHYMFFAPYYENTKKPSAMKIPGYQQLLKYSHKPIDSNSITSHSNLLWINCEMFQKCLRPWEPGCMETYSLFLFEEEGISVSFTALYSAFSCSPSDGKGHNRCPTPSLFKSTWISFMVPMVNVMHHFHSPNVQTPPQILLELTLVSIFTVSRHFPGTSTVLGIFRKSAWSVSVSDLGHLP